MRAFVFAVIASAVTGCMPARPVTLTAPAPANALACVLGRATDLNFSIIGGGVADGFLRLHGRVGLTLADAGKETVARLATVGLVGNNRVTAHLIEAVGGDGRVRVTVGSMKGNRLVSPTPEAQQIAQSIVTACQAPPVDSTAPAPRP